MKDVGVWKNKKQNRKHDETKGENKKTGKFSIPFVIYHRVVKLLTHVYRSFLLLFVEPIKFLSVTKSFPLDAARGRVRRFYHYVNTKRGSSM